MARAAVFQVGEVGRGGGGGWIYAQREAGGRGLP